MTTYRIETRPANSTDARAWTDQTIGDQNEFDSAAEGWQTIADLAQVDFAALGIEAAGAGDSETVRDCKRAVKGDAEAIEACVQVVLDAEAQLDWDDMPDVTGWRRSQYRVVCVAVRDALRELTQEAQTDGAYAVEPHEYAHEIAVAIKFLTAEPTSDGHYRYVDLATGDIWEVTLDELADLGGELNMDMENRAYSLWCASGAGELVSAV